MSTANNQGSHYPNLFFGSSQISPSLADSSNIFFCKISVEEVEVQGQNNSAKHHQKHRSSMNGLLLQLEFEIYQMSCSQQILRMPSGFNQLKIPCATDTFIKCQLYQHCCSYQQGKGKFTLTGTPFHELVLIGIDYISVFINLVHSN